MKILKKISRTEYLYSLMEGDVADIELFPLFQIHYSRLLDPQIVSIRLNDSGILINRKTPNEFPLDELLFSEEQYGHFHNTQNLSSKEIYNNFIYDSNNEKLSEISNLLEDLQDYTIKEWNLFGHFPLAYDLYYSYSHSNGSKEELEQKLDQLHESVNDIINISYRFSDYLLKSCADKAIELIRSNIAEDPIIRCHYQNFQTEITYRHSFENEIEHYCSEIFDQMSDIEKKAIEYHLTDMKRVDVRQSGHYDFYIDEHDSTSSFLCSLISNVTSKLKKEPFKLL